MRAAFKEWAVIVDALARGEQIIILRKGGLREGPGGFQVDEDQFWLFPTLFHQQRDAVVASAQNRFDLLQPHFPPAGVLRLGSFARVAAWQRLDSLAAAERLAGQHVWRDEVIAQRFDWGRAQIHALAVRIFNLPSPVDLPLRPEYSGCKSWVTLADEIPTETAVPAMEDSAFSSKLAQFQSALAGVAC